jgi:hypothetical protein
MNHSNEIENSRLAEIAFLEEDAWFREVEREWRSRLPKPTIKELFEMYPGANQVLEAKIEEESTKLEGAIRVLKEEIWNNRDESASTQEFLHEIWKQITIGPVIEESNRRILSYRRHMAVAKGVEVRGGIPPEDIEAAKHVHIETMLEGGKRMTSSHVYARCPFHDDRSPSLVVYRKSNTFHCFGCQAHGDSIDFVMRKDGVSFKEAVHELART